MNLRILKKLSKRAAPLLPLLGDTRKVFHAEKNDSYVSIHGCDRKHWERLSCDHPMPGRGKIIYTPRHGGKQIVMWSPSNPLKGTAMVGAMSGYEEPEWDEQSAWESLCDLVWNHFTTWEDVTDSCGDCEWPTPTCSRDLSTPKLVFAAAQEMLFNKKGNAA